MSQSVTVVGMDLGDRTAHLCLVAAGGQVVEEGRLMPTPTVIEYRFGSMPWWEQVSDLLGEARRLCDARRMEAAPPPGSWLHRRVRLAGLVAGCLALACLGLGWAVSRSGPPDRSYYTSTGECEPDFIEVRGAPGPDGNQLLCLDPGTATCTGDPNL